VPSQEELDRIAAILNSGKRVAIYAGSGSQDAHDEILATAQKLMAPVAHTRGERISSSTTTRTTSE